MSRVETGGQEPEFAVLVGIDWADQKHGVLSADLRDLS
jgi:hypothetical protein